MIGTIYHWISRTSIMIKMFRVVCYQILMLEKKVYYLICIIVTYMAMGEGEGGPILMLNKLNNEPKLSNYGGKKAKQ